MSKNYYDILQVNENASPEIIEKAYKVLAKKYHPDLQTPENKKQAEEILKEINEAYEILSDARKKHIYDNSLAEKRERENEKQQQYQQQTYTNAIPKTDYTREKESHLKSQQELLYEQQLQREKQYQEELRRRQEELAYQERLQQARQKAYHDAYIQDLKNRGYKIRYKKSLKDYIKGFLTLIITLFILFLLWQIPFVQDYFFNFLQQFKIN